MRINTREELDALRSDSLGLLKVREESNSHTSGEVMGFSKDNQKLELLVCAGTGCKASLSDGIISSLRESVEKHLPNAGVKVVPTGCFGFCEKGPIVKVIPDNTFYVQVTPEDAEEIVVKHLVEGARVERLLYVNPDDKQVIPDSKNIPFYKKQMRVALRNCGYIDPEDINEYVANDGYQALAKSLFDYKPSGIIDLIKASGLRGRGGAGFSTGMKWGFAAKNEADQKYVVCNADEGDPGAFMDRSIMEGDPHSVIEAMAICGYSIGASMGLIYIRAEYPLAIDRLKIAISQARERGLIGQNILGTDFSFDIDIRYGAGAFVCGEETALIHSMEGERGEPTVKPPFPAESGYLGKPTNVNNVETLANIPVIINKGAEWFGTIGTAASKGTKVFALAGKINNVGLIEVPMGTTLREVIYDIGGGIKDGKKFKAVQTGGPSGGCLTEKHLDVPIDFDSLTAAGSMMGSGGMIVMDEDDCMVAVSKFYLEFSVEESCGKCTPCRIGNKRLYEQLDLISNGSATEENLKTLRQLCHVIKDTALCGLGQTSPNPVLSTLDNFYDEYLAHVNGSCPAGQCKSLLSYQITDACKGCTLCKRNCPVDCIAGEVKKLHVIDQTKCIKCGNCEQVCKFKAIKIC